MGMSKQEVMRELRERMDEFGLHDWQAKPSSAKQQFGVCRYRQKAIAISIPLAELNPREVTLDTILHEIAHALVGAGAGHGPEWKAMCRRVGASPERTVRAATPPPRWLGRCPKNSYHVAKKHRRNKDLACGRCCRAYNGGRWSEDFRYVWEDTYATKVDSEPEFVLDFS